MAENNKFIKNNKNLWNKLTEINSKSDFYNVAGFKQGQTSLKKIELEEIGTVKGKTLLHLQCHFGLDTLSWAREGAIVTGVDLSDEGVKLAQELSAELNIPAKFICSDIYDLPKTLNEKFDIVFTSYGVLVWLDDLDKWAEIIAHYLKPGGTFYIVEFHPFANLFDEQWQEITGSYLNSKNPLCVKQEGSYADTSVDFSHISYEWLHPLSEVQNALRQVGLIIEFFHEFPYSAYNCFPSLVENKPNQFTLQNNIDIPLMYSIKATYMPDLAFKKR